MAAARPAAAPLLLLLLLPRPRGARPAGSGPAPGEGPDDAARAAWADALRRAPADSAAMAAHSAAAVAAALGEHYPAVEPGTAGAEVRAWAAGGDETRRLRARRLLLAVADVSRALGAGCNGSRADAVYAAMAFGRGCLESAAERAAAAGAPYGGRTVPCSAVPALAAATERACPPLRALRAREFPWHWHPMLPHARAPDAYYYARARARGEDTRSGAGGEGGGAYADAAGGRSPGAARARAQHARSGGSRKPGGGGGGPANVSAAARGATATAGPASATHRPAACARFEVAHLHDHAPGPPWLYAAPGSGAWFDPGARCAMFNNAVDAAIGLHGLRATAAALAGVGSGDARYEFRLLHGGLTLEAALLRAASARDRHQGLAAVPLALSALLLAPPGARPAPRRRRRQQQQAGGGAAVELPPPPPDSLLLLRQFDHGHHVLWTEPGLRGFDRALAYTYLYNASSGACIGQAALERHLYYAPEVVALRVAREAGWGGPADTRVRSWGRALLRHLSADAAGAQPCAAHARADTCVACTARARALCACGTFTGSGARMERLAKCCERARARGWAPRARGGKAAPAAPPPAATTNGSRGSDGRGGRSTRHGGRPEAVPLDEAQWPSDRPAHPPRGGYFPPADDDGPYSDAVLSAHSTAGL